MGMKKANLSIIFFVLLLSFFGCRKNNDAIPYGSSVNYSNVSGTPVNAGGAFSFTSIIVKPNPLVKGQACKVTAIATGNNLTYTWSTSHGELFGNGSAVYYSDSCVGTYTITCVVSDGTHTKTITVPVTISD